MFASCWSDPHEVITLSMLPHHWQRTAGPFCYPRMELTNTLPQNYYLTNCFEGSSSDHFHCSAIYTYLLQSSLLATIIQVAKQYLAVPKINYHCQILIKIHITAHEQVEAF